MSDNTQVQAGSGDFVRDIDRLLNGIKTQVTQLDFGGAQSNAEQLVTLLTGLPVQEVGPLAVQNQMLNYILREHMITNHILKLGLSVPDDLDALRADPAFNTMFISPTPS
jgi:hypothetical protein